MTFSVVLHVKKKILYESESAEAYNRKLLQLKSKWLQIEKEQTNNRPLNQFVDYFESYKEKQIRDKMIKGVRKQASIDGVYGQNPIEWQNFVKYQPRFIQKVVVIETPLFQSA